MAISYKNLPDEGLMHQVAIKQDKEAFEVLFARYKHLALGVCLKYLPDEEKAKDAVQNIFLKIWTDSYRFKIDRFKPWLFVVIKNHCLMELRKQDPTVSLDVSLEKGDMEWTDYLHLKVKEEQLIEHLNNCLQQLNEAQQKCIRGFYLDEMSYQETAIANGFTDKEVKSHIQNGRRNLRACMELKTAGK